jgi:anaerobic dimethyl sulfoxide reductase subunit B
MKKQTGFYFDSSSCSGCKTCQMACRDKHNLGRGIIWRRVYEVAGGEWKKEGQAWVPDIYSYYVSLSCNHCGKPVCLESCPNRAVYKDERGFVLIDEKRCMGCRYCEWTCPYGALHYDAGKGVMTKCTMCADYISIGKLPACVAACPMRVLSAGEMEMPDDGGKWKENRPDMYPLPDPAITVPALLIKPHPHSIRAARDKLTINNREEVKDEQ